VRQLLELALAKVVNVVRDIVLLERPERQSASRCTTCKAVVVGVGSVELPPTRHVEHNALYREQQRFGWVLAAIVRQLLLAPEPIRSLWIIAIVAFDQQPSLCVLEYRVSAQRTVGTASELLYNRERTNSSADTTTASTTSTTTTSGTMLLFALDVAGATLRDDGALALSFGDGGIHSEGESGRSEATNE